MMSLSRSIFILAQLTTAGVLMPAMSPDVSGTGLSGANLASAHQTLSTPSDSEADFQNVKVFFVLGGPGAGKGTQCERLAREFDFVHLSAGDLLREERSRPESRYGQLINEHIREGTIVPMHITIALLKAAMRQAMPDGRRRFLIDGFPRNIEQGIAFEKETRPCHAVLFFDASEDTLISRLLGRGITSGRDDDNIESIRKRLVTYRDTTMPVIKHYTAQEKVFTINSEDSIERVSQAVKDAISKF